MRDGKEYNLSSYEEAGIYPKLPSLKDIIKIGMMAIIGSYLIYCLCLAFVIGDLRLNNNYCIVDTNESRIKYFSRMFNKPATILGCWLSEPVGGKK